MTIKEIVTGRYLDLDIGKYVCWNGFEWIPIYDVTFE